MININEDEQYPKAFQNLGKCMFWKHGFIGSTNNVEQLIILLNLKTIFAYLIYFNFSLIYFYLSYPLTSFFTLFHILSKIVNLLWNKIYLSHCDFSLIISLFYFSYE